MTPVFKSPLPSGDVKEDLEFLNLQIEVGSKLLASPVILKYLEMQMSHLVSELVDINQDPRGDASRLKDAVLLRTQQIAAYRHLHDLASKHTEMQQSYEVLRTQYSN